MNTTKNCPSAKLIARHLLQCALAATTLLFSACSALIVHPKPSANATQRSGQVKFSSSTENIVGDIVIRYDEKNLLAEITKGPGVTLLTLSAEFETDPAKGHLKERHMKIVRASGPLSKGGYVWRPTNLSEKNYTKKLKDPSRAWGALPEVFMWGEAKANGQDFRVCFPDIFMRARAGNGEVLKFNYTRHEKPPEAALDMKQLRKQPVRETVICHLDS